MPARRTPPAMRLLTGQAPTYPPNLGGGLGAPDPPRWLSREGRAEWRRVVKACEDWPTWLQEVDRAALSAYCSAWSTFVDAAKDVAERGPLVPARSSADGDAKVKNPAVQIVRDSSEAMRKWSRELGFTPDARGRVDVGQREEADDGHPFA
jgi:P27 family predicted phage terminase small subunit